MSLLDRVMEVQRRDLIDFRSELMGIEQGGQRKRHNHGEGWVDVTDERAGWLRNKVAEIEAWLAKYDEAAACSDGGE